MLQFKLKLRYLKKPVVVEARFVANISERRSAGHDQLLCQALQPNATLTAGP